MDILYFIKILNNMEKDSKKAKRMTKKQREEATVNDLANKIYEEIIGAGDPIPKTDSEVKDEVDAEEAKRQAELEAEIDYKHRFYDVSSDRSGNLKIEIDVVGVLDILHDLGYCRYDNPDGTIEYVRIQDCKIMRVLSTAKIIDDFEDYVVSLPDRKVHRILHYDREGDPIWSDDIITGDKLRRKLFKNIGYYFSALQRLRPDIPITTMHDTPNNKYLFFNNGFVRIGLKDYKFYPYSALSDLSAETGEENGQYVWEHDIINRDFNINTTEGDFAKFCKYICGITEHNNSKESIDRFLSLRSILGYLLHDNYECNLKTILFIDVNKNNPQKPMGGTGKGILGKALRAIINRDINVDKKYIAVGGKGFDPKFDRRYSEGDITTKLIHIEDIANNFDFNNFFNDVTDGALFRKAGENESHHMCKTMLSSNVPIDTSSTSNKRRLVIFELDNYFTATRTPQDVFGKRFFESKWTVVDWSQFDNFMVNCCCCYMWNKDEVEADGKTIRGIIEPPLINYKQQLLQSKLTKEFIDWFEEQISEAVLNMRTTEFIKTDLFDAFVKKYPEYYSREKYARAFSRWCRFYLETMEIPSGEKRSTKDLFILYPPLGDSKIDYIGTVVY